MIDVSWHIEEEDREGELTGPPRALLGTWHYLRNSLRREWRTWMGMAAVGAILGFAAVYLLPASSTGTVTVLMSHPANLDGPSAMATDLSLLNTREVAAKTVSQLGLKLTPEAFQATVAAEALTTEILTITVSAPDDRSAVARANALTQQYLDFRAAQLRSMASGTISGYQKRIAAMQQQVTALNTEYAQVSEQGAAGQNRASEILTQRSELNSQITDMQQAVEDAALAPDAAISSTHVIDPARALRRSGKKTIVLDVGSGLIAGTALGVGFVLFRALTSDRLRRRRDVALALGTPVRFSVASQRGRERRPGRLGGRRARKGWHGRDLEALVHGLESAVMRPSTVAATGGAPTSNPTATPTTTATSGPRQSVALAAIGNAGVAATVVGALATHLRRLGLSVFLVDLSPSAALVAHMSSTRRRRRLLFRKRSRAEGMAHGGADSAVFRPSVGPGLARGPREAAAGTLVDLPSDDAWLGSWYAADVVLALAEVDPGLDAENLRSWVSQVVPLVTAGQSSPELLQTTAELVRAAALPMPFAMMVGCDDTDESLGLVDPSHAERAPR